jgi:hypothetical protein
MCSFSGRTDTECEPHCTHASGIKQSASGLLFGPTWTVRPERSCISRRQTSALVLGSIGCISTKQPHMGHRAVGRNVRALGYSPGFPNDPSQVSVMSDSLILWSAVATNEMASEDRYGQESLLCPNYGPAAVKWTEALTAREWATAIWVVVAVIAMAFRRDLRQHMLAIINVWRSPTLAVPVSLMLAYVAAVVFGASQIDLWNTRMIGATLAWTITVAFVGFFRVNRVAEVRRFTRKEARRAIELAVVLDAYLNLFVLPFAAEMFLVPFLVFVGLMLGAAEYLPQLEDTEYDQTRSCLKSFVGVLGLAAVVYGTVRVIEEIAAGKLGSLGRGLILPLWLNIALIPCILLIGVWAAYHDAFIRLQIGADPSPAALRRAKRALIREVGLHVYALGCFGPPWPYRFGQAHTVAEAREVARALIAERAAAARAEEASAAQRS